MSATRGLLVKPGVKGCYSASVIFDGPFGCRLAVELKLRDLEEAEQYAEAIAAVVEAELERQRLVKLTRGPAAP